MTPDSVGPLSRPLPLHRVTPAGLDVLVEATSEERAALAADFHLVAIHRLDARFVVSGHAERVRVRGRITADVEQTCVVSLEAFPARVDEDVEVTFAAPTHRDRLPPPAEIEFSLEHEPPEELLGDHIDLGTITAEFLALALDPHPRKPGVTFEAPHGDPSSSPFARLAELRSAKADD